MSGCEDAEVLTVDASADLFVGVLCSPVRRISDPRHHVVQHQPHLSEESGLIAASG